MVRKRVRVFVYVRTCMCVCVSMRVHACVFGWCVRACERAHELVRARAKVCSERHTSVHIQDNKLHATNYLQ